jgi:hypothetical protein
MPFFKVSIDIRRKRGFKELAMTSNYGNDRVDQTVDKRKKNEDLLTCFSSVLRAFGSLDNFPFWVLFLIAALSLVSRLVLLLR